MLGGADIYSCFFQSGSVRVNDVWSTSTGSAPPIDPIQNVLPGFSGYRSGGTTAVRFQRLLNTMDGARDRAITPGVMELLAGYGPDDNWQDKHTDAALFYVDLSMTSR